MTTSITDARFTHLHATDEHILALLANEKAQFDKWDEPLPGFAENIDVPPFLEPPRLDADEVLPSQLHPSYPYGRPAKSKSERQSQQRTHNLQHAVASLLDPRVAEDKWDELNLGAIVERQDGKEVPPVMAGSKRPPSPPSPSLRPNSQLQPRSEHLRRHLERQRQATPSAPADPFDAPVPNETYAEDDPDNPNNTMPEQGMEMMDRSGASPE